MTSTLNLEGEQVRVRLENGAMMRGDVQEVTTDSVKVKGRWFPISAVQTEEEIENLIYERQRADRERQERERRENIAEHQRLYPCKIPGSSPDRAFDGRTGTSYATAPRVKITYSAEFLELWQEAKIENKLHQKRVDLDTALELAYRADGTPNIPIMLPVGGTYADFVTLLNDIGYYFDVRVREDGAADADAQYAEWAGECLPEFAVYFHKNDDAWTAVEWRVLATVPKNTVFPFETAVAGTLGRGHTVNSALLDGCKLTINCTDIVEQLTRAGLRVRKNGSCRG
jgi:hypothetical protein